MADYMFSDSNYDYYGSKMNRPIQGRTVITAKDSRDNITFHSESKGRLNRYAIDKILKAWAVDTHKERVDVFYI